MKKLVRLWKRPSRDGKRFSYMLIYRDAQGKNRYESLGHKDGRKARRQCSQKERELCMGYVKPGTMRLSELLEDCLLRTRGQVSLSPGKCNLRNFSEIPALSRHICNLVTT